MEGICIPMEKYKFFVIVARGVWLIDAEEKMLLITWL